MLELQALELPHLCDKRPDLVCRVREDICEEKPDWGRGDIVSG